MERWPRRRKHDGEVADRGEERRTQQVPYEFKRPRLVGWVRKEETELGQALSRRWRHYGDGKSSTELDGGNGKSRGREKAKTTAMQAL